MKNRFLHFLLLSLLANGLFAQMDVALHLHPKLGEQSFALNTTATAEMGYPFRVTRLQYYVSEIRLVHDGGQVTPVTDRYLLVTAQKDSIFELGSFPVTTIEGIEFSIGVDADHNHLDPASYANDHALAPKNPSMHWGWAAGYRFIALEGKTSNNGGSTFPDVFQVHTIDDANYQNLSIPVEAVIDGGHLAINLDANYHHILAELDVTGGVTSHAATGASATIAENMKNHVFTASVVSGVTEPGVVGTFGISPNPTNGNATLRYDLPGYEQLTLTVSDLAGRTVLTKELSGSAQSVSLEINWQPGVYVARIFSGDRILALEKLVVK
jgi:hypothetical protein